MAPLSFEFDMKYFKKTILIFVSLHVLSGIAMRFAAADTDEQTFLLSPQLIELELLPGEKSKFSVLLVNKSKTQKARFSVYLSDLGEKRSGKYEVLDRGSSPYSCSSWINLSHSEVEIDANKGAEVFGEIIVPRGVDGGRYSVIVFELAPRPRSKEEKLGTLTLHHRMTTAIEITVKGRRNDKKAVISSLDVISDNESKALARYGKNLLMFTASLKNEGNILVIGKGTLTIRTGNGRRVRQIPLGGGRGAVLPSAIVDFRSIIAKDFPSGKYSAEAVIKFGGLRPAQANLNFIVKKEVNSLAKTGSFTSISDINFKTEPSRLEVVANSRSLKALGIIVNNQHDKAIFVNGHGGALEYNSFAELVTKNQVGGQYSCGEWLTLNPSSFVLQPNEKKVVRIMLNVPDGASGGNYANIVFEASDASKGKNTAKRKTYSNVPLFLTVRGKIEEQANIGKIRIADLNKKESWKFVVSFKNTGNIHLKPSGKVVIKKALKVNMKGNVEYIGEPDYEDVGEVAFKQLEEVVLPGGNRELVAIYNSPLPEGNYVAQVEIDYGKQKKLAQKETFTVASVTKE